MASTTSFGWPNIFDTARNRVGIIEDDTSVVSRSRLLILTEPTEVFNNPNQGVGLKRHLWKYNTENEKAIICDRIKDQLDIHEPCCIADDTQFSDGLLFTDSLEFDDETQNFQQLKMTVGIRTIYTENSTVLDLTDELGGNI